MEFGKDSVYQFVKQNCMASQDPEWYKHVYNVVKADTLSVLSAYRLQKDDKDDIIQEVQLEVIKRLVKFVHDSENNTEAQRNAWLHTIINSKICDFFRKKYKRIEDSIEDLLLNTKKHKEFASSNNIEERIKQLEVQSKLLEAIELVCNINTSPEKIISFLFSRVIGVLELSRKNGSPLQVVQELNGKTLKGASELLKRKLQSVLTILIPDDVYKGLDDKIEQEYLINVCSRTFMIDPRTIADSSNWIGKKIKQNELKTDETKHKKTPKNNEFKEDSNK